ncbi:ABC transporter permease [Jiulongibacter sediminis]|jgi:putative ABC transport system permease protein|uniref:ABC transporter permease n=1 Tax=Jiulongibacter sediminis TaxID=1605367 RepID=UPI0026EFA697|nr:ABC transporter permease [Jiulongibacter sediminis]
MIRNYLKIAWRNLRKQPFFTFLNTFGLAIGMAGGLLITLYIVDELSYNRSFKDFDRIHRAQVDIKFGGQAQEFAVLVAPFAETVKRDFDVVEDATRLRQWGSMLVRRPETIENQKEEKSTFADVNFIDFFGLRLLEGDSKTALKDPNTVVLTYEAAKKYFGECSALGQNVVINNDENFTVTGVLDGVPSNSFLNGYSVFMSMESHAESRDPDWGSNNFNTFLKLIPNARAEDLQQPLQILFEKYMVPYAESFMPGINRESFEAEGNYIRYATIPLTELHLSGNRVAEMNPNSTLQTIYILSFVALFLIVLAIVNFMNLSTAQSLKRAKEVGIRKTLGSNKTGLVSQFLTESGLVSFLSLILALLVAVVFMPLFNELTGKGISIPFLNPLFWLVILSVTLFLGMVSGSYPAFFLSRFIPVQVLKGDGKTTGGGGKVRNALVVFQFAVSVFLMVSTLVVYYQLNYIQNKDLGYSKDQLLIVDDVYAAGNQVETFKNQVADLPMVASATISSFLPTPSNRSDSGFDLEGPEDKTIQMQNWRVDHDYVKTLDLEIVAGRDFDRQFSTDSSAILVNESALSILGIQPDEAIGKRVTNVAATGIERDYFTIVGVVRNFHFESFKDKIGPLALNITPGHRNKMTVKLKAGDFSSTISQIKAEWNNVAPGQPFNHYFLDDSFNNTYQTERRLGNIFMTFTVLSLLIACLGLFGLAAFNAQKRTKEIGVRKVMGASVNQIAMKLSTDFLKLVGGAILVALPLSWYAMNQWLNDFTYRIDIAWWIFAVAAIAAVLIALLTVSYQAIKAAIVNPVKSLRSE